MALTPLGTVFEKRALAYCTGMSNCKLQKEYELEVDADVNVIGKMDRTLEWSFQEIIKREQLNKSKWTVSKGTCNAGIYGIVADLTFFNGNKDVPISLKHNNKSIRHLRLNSNNPFGNLPFAEEYLQWNIELNHVFTEMHVLKEKKTKWKNVSQKTVYYKQFLSSLKTQIEHYANKYKNFPEQLTRHLVGRQDFYKITNYKKGATLECYNFSGSLNAPKLDLPTKLLSVQFKVSDKNVVSNNTLVLEFDNNWTFSLRIHSASSDVETSFKLDVTLLEKPASISIFAC